MKNNTKPYYRKMRLLFSIYFMCFAVLVSWGQDDAAKRTIAGKIVDGSTGMSISGAKIVAPQTGISTISKEEGKFTIDINENENIVLITADGFLPQKGKATNGVVIELVSDAFTNISIDFSGLLGNQAFPLEGNFKPNIPLSGFESVDNQIGTLKNGDVRSISRSGVNTVGNQLFLNGLNSVFGNNQPLYVVDGVIWEDVNVAGSLYSGFYINPLSVIDPDNVESIEIIRNGTAIYGSKGANGVILINTKRGGSLVTKIYASSIVGITEAPSTIPTMNASDFRIYASEIMGTIKGIDKNIDTYEFLDDDVAASYYNKFHNNTNWFDEVFRTAVSSKSNISVEGGDERAKYLFTVGYRHDEGVVKATDLQKLSARFNADINFTDNFITSWNISYADINRNLVNYGVNSESPMFLSYIKSPFLSPYAYTSVGEVTNDYDDSDLFNVGNPGAILENGLSENSQYRFNIGITPKYQLSKKITLSDHFDYSLYNIRDRYFRPSLGSAEVLMPDGGTSLSMVANQSSKTLSLFNDFQITYLNKFSNSNALNIYGGYRFYSTNYLAVIGRGHNTPDDNYKSLRDTRDYRSMDSFDDKSKSISIYTNGLYRFNDRYQLNFSLSMDASSRFGSETSGFNFLGTDWATFYSLGGEWLVSSEKFMNSVKFIDLLKLRAGYDVNGNDDIGYYNKYPYLESKYFMTKAVGLVIGNIANTSIQWETTKSLNAGLDMAMFKDRLNLSVNGYLNTTEDLLRYKNLPAEVGMYTYYANGGTMSNNGYNVSANLRVINKQKIKWEVGCSVGHYINKIETLPDGPSYASVYGGMFVTQEGYAANSFYGFKTTGDGIYKTSSEATNESLKIIDENGNDHYFGAGDVSFEDINNDKIIDKNDRQVIGDPNPDYFGNITTRLIIDKFEFSGVLTYSYGNDVYNYLRRELESGSSVANQSTAMLLRWRNEGQDDAVLPKAVYGDPMGNARFSDRWIEDGSYLKLSAVSISYDIPLSPDAIFNGVKVWVSANNLFTVTNYLGRDPETSVGNATLLQGIDTGILPSSRNISFGIKLSL